MYLFKASTKRLRRCFCASLSGFGAPSTWGEAGWDSPSTTHKSVPVSGVNASFLLLLRRVVLQNLRPLLEIIPESLDVIFG